MSGGESRLVLSRRGLFACACCLVPAAPAFARATIPRFFCATPDVDESAATPQRRGAGRGRFPTVKATLDRSKLWTHADGATPNTGLITLNISFLNGTRADHDKVRRIAPQWTQGRLGRRIAFRFGSSAGSSHVRISFRGKGGSVSEVGRDGLAKPKHHPTMNLSVVDQRDILHEFGHVLGLKHEHQHPASGIRWNKAAVRAALMPPPTSWSEAKIEQNIFDHFSKDCTCKGDPTADPLSIMLYPIDPSWTLDGKGTGRNTKISARDRRCLVREYGA